ncbi:MAG: dTMP kinase [Holosporales bacterium]|jgi:dTMP kinase|nr:dTMP kinase [Holosporales bacterium]
MGKTGLFITLEGLDGSGKTVQGEKLYRALAEAFENKVIMTREPGGVEGAEDIRKVLLQGDSGKFHPVSEVFLFYAARYEHFYRRIYPALADGYIVVCDRFIDSSIAYQGAGKGVPTKFFDYIHEILAFPPSQQLIHKIVPDRTYIFDIDPAISVARLTSRQQQGNSSNDRPDDRFEKLSTDFHEKVRQGYLDIAKQDPARCRVVDASNSVEFIHNEILKDALLLVNDMAVDTPYAGDELFY